MEERKWELGYALKEGCSLKRPSLVVMRLWGGDPLSFREEHYTAPWANTSPCSWSPSDWEARERWDTGLWGNEGFSGAEIIWAVISVERVLMTLCSSEKLWRLVRNEPLASAVNAGGSSQLLHLAAAGQTSGPAWKACWIPALA